jgi:hypothetical protein
MESKLGPLGTSVTSGLLYLPWVIVRMENLVERRLAGEPKYSEKTCPSDTFFTTNPTCPDSVSNLGHCGGNQQLSTWALAWPDHTEITIPLFAAQLLIKYGMTYFTVACTTAGTGCAENKISLLLFTDPCLVVATCFDSTIIDLCKYATIVTGSSCVTIKLGI